MKKKDSQCLLEKAGSTRLEKVLTNVKVNFAVVELSRLRAALVGHLMPASWYVHMVVYTTTAVAGS